MIWKSIFAGIIRLQRIRIWMNVCPVTTILTLVINILLNGSDNFTERDIKDLDDDDIMKKLRSNPMKEFLTCLSRSLASESDRAKTLRKEKEQQARKKQAASISALAQSQDEFLPLSDLAIPDISDTSTPPASAPTVSMSSIQHKRTASQLSSASYLTDSTDSSSQNIEQAEAIIQDLQNTFVRIILNCLEWELGVPVTWAQGRKMWLSYLPSSSLCHSLIL